MNTANVKPDFSFKYIVIGNAAVGKSNIISRYTKGQFFENYQMTINLEYSSKDIKIKDKTYRVSLWDTAGQEEFRSISRGYYKSAVCGLVVYDITNRDSFNNLSSWVEECRNNGPKTISLVLVGNKTDLENKRQVTYEEGEEFANRNNMQFFETSALNGNGIDKLFNDSVEAIIRKIENNYYKDPDCGIDFNQNKKIDLQKKDEKKKKNAAKLKCEIIIILYLNI